MFYMRPKTQLTIECVFYEVRDGAKGRSEHNIAKPDGITSIDDINS